MTNSLEPSVLAELLKYKSDEVPNFGATGLKHFGIL